MGWYALGVKTVSMLALFGLVLLAGCRGPAIRTIRTAGIDASSGTAYAFEVTASDRQAETTVIVCNVALPAICYRMHVDRLDQTDGLRAVQRLLEQARRDRALAESPAPPPVAPATAPEPTPPMSIDF